MLNDNPYDQLSEHQRRYWWWNARFGRLARRDLMIYWARELGWVVELRDGGIEGRRRWVPVAGETDALDLAGTLLVEGDGWTVMTTRATDPEP